MQHKAHSTDGGEAVETVLRALLAETLGLPPERVAAFGESSPLFGSLPELDSLGVAALLTGIEERLAVLIDDHDVAAEDFATYGSLLAFARRIALR